VNQKRKDVWKSSCRGGGGQSDGDAKGGETVELRGKNIFWVLVFFGVLRTGSFWGGKRRRKESPRGRVRRKKKRKRGGEEKKPFTLDLRLGGEGGKGGRGEKTPLKKRKGKKKLTKEAPPRGGKGVAVHLHQFFGRRRRKKNNGSVAEKKGEQRLDWYIRA